MAKINPANKAREAMGCQSKESAGITVEEMMSNYEKYKETCSRAENSADYIDRLPDGVEFDYDRWEVFVPDARQVYDSMKVRMYLTDLRKDVLIEHAKDPDATQRDIADRAGCSISVVSRSINNFKPLLEDPELFEAFVLTGFKTKEQEKLEIYGNSSGEPASEEDADTNPQEDVETETPNGGERDMSENTQQVAADVVIGLDNDEFSQILGELYRNDEDDLAQRLLEAQID